MKSLSKRWVLLYVLHPPETQLNLNHPPPIPQLFAAWVDHNCNTIFASGWAAAHTHRPPTVKIFDWSVTDDAGYQSVHVQGRFNKQVEMTDVCQYLHL